MKASAKGNRPKATRACTGCTPRRTVPTYCCAAAHAGVAMDRLKPDDHHESSVEQVEGRC
jgi:hypothetical protein